MVYFICFLSLLAQIAFSNSVLLEIKTYLLTVKKAQDYLICGSEVAAYINESSAIQLIGTIHDPFRGEPSCAAKTNIQIRYQDDGVVDKPFPNYVLARGPS